MIFILKINLPLSRACGDCLTHVWRLNSIVCCDILGDQLSWTILTGVFLFAISTFFFWRRYQLALNQNPDRNFHFFEGSALDFYSKTYGNDLALGLIFGVAFGAATVSVLLWKMILN